MLNGISVDRKYPQCGGKCRWLDETSAKVVLRCIKSDENGIRWKQTQYVVEKHL